MKRSVIRAIPWVFSSVLMASVSFAGHSDDYSLSHECRHIASELTDLVIGKSAHEPCVGDIDIAAAYIESAGFLVERGKYSQALQSLACSENELNGITSFRAYCMPYASLVKPYLAKVIVLEAKMESIRNLKSGVDHD